MIIKKIAECHYFFKHSYSYVYTMLSLTRLFLSGASICTILVYPFVKSLKNKVGKEFSAMRADVVFILRYNYHYNRNVSQLRQ